MGGKQQPGLLLRAEPARLRLQRGYALQHPGRVLAAALGLQHQRGDRGQVADQRAVVVAVAVAPLDPVERQLEGVGGPLLVAIEGEGRAELRIGEPARHALTVIVEEIAQRAEIAGPRAG